MIPIEEKELNQLQTEAFEHLHKGRARLAYPLAEKLYNHRPDNSIAALCFAWACLETGEVARAKSLTDLSENLKGDTIITNLYLGYMQMRLSSFEGAIYNFNMSEGIQKNLLAWTYLNKSKSLVLINEIEKGHNFYNLALIIANNGNPEWKKLKKYFNYLDKIDRAIENELEIPKIIEFIKESYQEKEYWFSLFAINKLATVENIFQKYPELRILHLETMQKLNQFTAIKEKIEEYQNFIEDKEKFESIVSAVRKYDLEKASPMTAALQGTANSGNLISHSNDFVSIKSFKLYDYSYKDDPEKNNLISVKLSRTENLGLNIVLKNNLYQQESKKYNCFIAWYFEDDLLYQTSFDLEIPVDWDAVLISDVCGLNEKNRIRKGNARIEFYLSKEKILDYNFLVGDEEKMKEVELENSGGGIYKFKKNFK